MLANRDTQKFGVYKGPAARPARLRSDQLGSIFSHRPGHEVKKGNLPEGGPASGEKGPEARTTAGEAFRASWLGVDAVPVA